MWSLSVEVLFVVEFGAFNLLACLTATVAQPGGTVAPPSGFWMNQPVRTVLLYYRSCVDNRELDSHLMWTYGLGGHLRCPHNPNF